MRSPSQSSKGKKTKKTPSKSSYSQAASDLDPTFHVRERQPIDYGLVWRRFRRHPVGKAFLWMLGVVFLLGLLVLLSKNQVRTFYFLLGLVFCGVGAASYIWYLLKQKGMPEGQQRDRQSKV